MRSAATHQSGGEMQLGLPARVNVEDSAAGRYHARPQADVAETGYDL